MDQYKMNANFRPALEPKNGHIGFADVTIANAVKIYDISVFQKDDKISFRFPDYLVEGDKRMGFVSAPAEARAQFANVIAMAVADPEYHFGHVNGRQDPYLTVTGHAVQEQYADARFSVQVGDLCTLHCIKTQEVNFDKEGNPGKFVAVGFPQRDPYEKDGEKVYPHVFEALKKGTVYNKETKEEEHKDFHALLKNLIRAERKKVLGLENEKKTPLKDKIASADQKAAAAPAEKNAPAMEAQR